MQSFTKLIAGGSISIASLAAFDSLHTEYKMGDAAVVIEAPVNQLPVSADWQPVSQDPADGFLPRAVPSEIRVADYSSKAAGGGGG